MLCAYLCVLFVVWQDFEPMVQTFLLMHSCIETQQNIVVFIPSKSTRMTFIARENSKDQTFRWHNFSHEVATQRVREGRGCVGWHEQSETKTQKIIYTLQATDISPLRKGKNHWTSSKVPLKGEGNYLSCREGRWNWGLLLGPRIFRGIRHFSRSQMLETLHIIGALRHWILHHGL